MLLTKSACAFMFTAERLAKQSEALYFWTFTFKTTPATDEHAMEDWNTLHRRLMMRFPLLEGVRVCELHRSHGIHFHCLLNLRIPIRRVQRICRGNGNLTGPNRYLDFGRMSVSKCDATAIPYLTKYMTKEYRRQNCFFGRRRWGTVGGFKGTLKNNIVVESETTRNKERMFGLARISFPTMIMVSHFTSLWGHVERWPMKDRALVFRQSLHGSSWLKHRYFTEPF